MNLFILAHTAIVIRIKVDNLFTEALRNSVSLPSEKLQALHIFTLSMVGSRGQVTQEELQAFYAAGYKESHVLEVILGLSQKVISNYTNHIANTPVDAPFQKYAWSKSESISK